MKLTKQRLKEIIKEELLNERMGFDEKEYIKRIAGHFQTGIILQKMAQQMDKENRSLKDVGGVVGIPALGQIARKFIGKK